VLFLLISIVYSEIMIKGGNRKSFEGVLVSNVTAALGKPGGLRIRRSPGRLIISCDALSDRNAAREALTRTFGVDYVSFPAEAKKDIGSIRDVALSSCGNLAGKAIKVDTKRSDKSFHMTSPEVNRVVGKAFVDAGCSVNLDNPEATISIEILPKMAMISTERHRGPGGLPVGSGGRVLSLLSGGIDSPVASWMMMRRGCTVDLLHVHSLPSNAEAIKSKMARIAAELGRHSPVPMRLFMAPYSEFYKKSMGLDPRIELVVFRRFLLGLASALAEEGGHLGIVTGDSVGQVASQTLENLFATDSAASMPVYRPLAGMNKQEIIDMSEKIGTYRASIEAYKDCCSLVAHRKPSTRVKRADAVAACDSIGLGEIVRKTISLGEWAEP
jgi:thiamine biosynthesis protein ThiI